MPDVTAKLEKIIWRSTENDFTIAAFSPEKITGPEFIGTGDLFTPAAGITYDMTGKWEEHPKYGKQFKIQSYCVKEPCDYVSIAVYLEKYIKGIGPVLADILIEKYGNDTIKVLKNAPIRVEREIKGVSYEKACAISEQLKEDDKRQDMLIKLEGMFSKVKGLPKRLSNDLIKLYGLTAYEVVKNNPYVLTEMNRVGFLSADKVAMACGVKPDAPERIKQGIIYVIKQTMNETGDVWLNPKTIAENLSNLINGIKDLDVVYAYDGLINSNILIRHNGHVTLIKFADDESLIADCVARFLT
jgi:exodeoxyribonuclease V alpha subunit